MKWQHDDLQKYKLWCLNRLEWCKKTMVHKFQSSDVYFISNLCKTYCGIITYRTWLLSGATVFSAAEGVALFAASLLVWLVFCSLAKYKTRHSIQWSSFRYFPTRTKECTNGWGEWEIISFCLSENVWSIPLTSYMLVCSIVWDPFPFNW